jgi:hypothetical protein
MPVYAAPPEKLHQFRVRRARNSPGVACDTRTVGTFPGLIAAEAFIQSEITTFRRFGADGGIYWARNFSSTTVRYWIETAQVTASAELRAEQQQPDRIL